ncbi:hypothetical protein Q8A73_013117 [Channa argus]|nr:hypothetical protein Q8A73_013117 [Channa argus]
MAAAAMTADLNEDIRQPSDDLKRKDSLLCSFNDIATGHSKQITSLSAALQDMAMCDPYTCSELTKRNFNDMLTFLSTSGKSVFISGPIPTFQQNPQRPRLAPV